MLHVIRRSFEADNDKKLHKTHLKNALNDILYRNFRILGVDYCGEELCFNKYGKPYLKNHNNLYFNITHCHELGAAVIDNTEVGVDAENIRSFYPRVAKRVCSERELEMLDNANDKNEMFFRLWTLKEAFVKTIGIGISYPLKTCEFLPYEDTITAYGCNGYTFTQYILNNKFVCSVCQKKAGRNSVHRIWEDNEAFQMELK